MSHSLSGGVVLFDGHVTIRAFVQGFFVEEPLPEGIDATASVRRYVELWEGEILRRYPKMIVVLHVSEGMRPPLIHLSDIPHEPGSTQEQRDEKHRAIFADVARLGMDLYEDRQSWLTEARPEAADDVVQAGGQPGDSGSGGGGQPDDAVEPDPRLGSLAS